MSPKQFQKELDTLQTISYKNLEALKDNLSRQKRYLLLQIDMIDIALKREKE